jgi:hypothetical protein
MSVTTLLGLASTVVLLATACASPAGPGGAPTTSAALSTPAPATAVPPSPSAQQSAGPSAGPSAGASSTPAKAEEKSETPSSGEESAEGPPQPNPLPPVAPGGDQTHAPVAGADITRNGAAASMHGSAVACQSVYERIALAATDRPARAEYRIPAQTMGPCRL